MYGISKQAAYKTGHASSGFEPTPREEVKKHFPWRVPAEMRDSSPDKRIRDHAEFMATGGDGMSDFKLGRLVNFYLKLRNENLVLEFDPSIPPNEHTGAGGYAYRPRQDSDGDLIIRVNEFTNLTPRGRRLWRFPPELPRVRVPDE